MKKGPSKEDAFLEMIQEEPSRLIWQEMYGDWLEEEGQVAKAEMVRRAAAKARLRMISAYKAVKDWLARKPAGKPIPEPPTHSPIDCKSIQEAARGGKGRARDIGLTSDPEEGWA